MANRLQVSLLAANNLYDEDDYEEMPESRAVLAERERWAAMIRLLNLLSFFNMGLIIAKTNVNTWLLVFNNMRAVRRVDEQEVILWLMRSELWLMRSTEPIAKNLLDFGTHQVSILRNNANIVDRRLASLSTTFLTTTDRWFCAKPYGHGQEGMGKMGVIGQ
ncbi:hypothetical protein IFR05_001679 [Cadophora sp. M221]|nr:hypothetical protein IFR05_001679 [Cadophora sp. M221]